MGPSLNLILQPALVTGSQFMGFLSLMGATPVNLSLTEISAEPLSPHLLINSTPGTKARASDVVRTQVDSPGQFCR